MDRSLFSLALGAWVVAVQPGPAVGARQVLAVWAGVGGPSSIQAQRWDPERRRITAHRERLRYVRPATSIDLTIHGVPIGRPVFRARFDPLNGPMFVPLRN
jgi:hypothetical protein